MPSQCRFLYATGKIEYFEGCIITGCHKFAIIRGESKVTDGVTVGLNCFDIVECRLPVLYNAILVC